MLAAFDDNGEFNELLLGNGLLPLSSSGLCSGGRGGGEGKMVVVVEGGLEGER